MVAKSVVLVTRKDRPRRLAAELAPHELIVAPDAGAVQRQLEHGPDLFLIDTDSWPGDPIDLLSEIVRAGGRAAVLTAQPTAELTLSALSRGALDVLPVPVPIDRLRQMLEPGKAEALPEVSAEQERWVGRSPTLLGAYRAAAAAAATPSHVLFIGERGVGKRLLARLTHAHSGMSADPFVVLHCGVLESALATELFGQEVPGSNSAPVLSHFERVGHGTLYLDELEQAASGLQARIADALITREFTPLGSMRSRLLKTRVMAGVHIDPHKHEERFRPALLLAFGVQIFVPPLRERADDVPLLAAWFAAAQARQHGKPIRGISSEEMRALEQYDWPGNVRELRSVIERAVIAAREDVIGLHHLPTELLGGQTDNIEIAELGDVTLASIERRHIRRILQFTGGRLSETAQLLGIHRNTLRRKLEEYDIKTTD